MGRPPQRLTAPIILLWLFLALIEASANKCNVGCHGTHTSKSYLEGHTYTYDLEGTAVTTVTEAQGEAGLKIRATVELSIQPDCTHQLRVKGTQINGAPAPLADIEQHPIQFNYHDGHIDTELCTVPGDSQASLNIKRAVVSLFQSAVLQDSGSITHHEIDVFGNCPTDFSFHKDGDSVVVQKYRDLSQCSHRENIRQGLISANFDAAAGIKSSPLLASQQKTEQRFKNGILNKAVSTETYLYRPFSNGDAGAKTIIETTLVLKGEKAGNGAGQVSLPKSLIFEVPHPVIKSSIDSITNALKAAKAEETNTVKEKAAAKFSELIKVLRVSQKNDILSVYHKVTAGAGFDAVADRKIFLGALFRAGSGEAAEVAVELIKNREITGVDALLFYTSLALVQHVNLPSVTAVTTLLDQRDLPRIGYLGVGQVIGKYCQEHSCEDVPEVKEAIHKIREKVGNGKTKTREQENLVVSALKALGNARFIDDGTLQKLANIAADKSVRNRVRVAAIEALPTRCSMKWKNTLFKVLSDYEEDTEVRIKTYLSLVACACPHVANHVKEVLDKEKINQVGSFITTHLRNLRASTDPSKQDAKKQLGLIKPRIKFPLDFRKYSYNHELSYYIDALGVGSTTESNVIYSQNSFVPRSVSLNVSTEIFGRLFNFLELNTRVENLDRVIEHYFGPKGVVSTYDTEEVSADTMHLVSDTAKLYRDRLNKLIRSKRDVKQGELDKFAKNVRLRGTEVDQDLDIDFAVKLFGVELAYLSYQGDVEKLNPKHIIDKIFDKVEKSLASFKNFNYKLVNHLHFLDAELVYPTGLGVPLSLGATGSSVVHLGTRGKVDLSAIARDPLNAAFNVVLEPSASITITGDLVLEACGVESGLKIVTTLHTSTSSDVSVKLLNGKGIDLNFGIPKKKQELISVSSEVLFTSGGKGDKYVAPKFSKGKEYSDCFDQFSGLLGLTVCGHVSFPYEGIESVQKKPFFPLSGPAKFSVTVENNDITSYHFKFHYNDQVPDVRSLEILLETPNSKTDRHVSLVVEGGLQPNKFVKIAFDSPIKKASVEAVLKSVPEEYTIAVTIHNDQIEYHARAGLLASGSKYKPILEYKVPEHIEKLAGTKRPAGERYNVQGTVDVADHEGGKKFVFDKVVLLAGSRKIVGLDGSVISTPTVVDVDMSVGYGDESLALKVLGKKNAEKNYALTLSAVPSKDPNVGFKLDWAYKDAGTEYDHRLVFIHGADFNSEVNRFTLIQQLAAKHESEGLVYYGKNEITYPVLNAKFKLAGKLSGKSLGGDLEVKYEKFKFGTEVSFKRDMTKLGEYEVEIEIDVLENSLEVKSKRTVIEVGRKSKFENSLVLSPGGKYQADGVVSHEISKNNVNLQLDGQLNLNGKVVKVDTGLETNPQVVNSRAFVIVDGTKYVEFTLKVRYGPNPNGDLRLNLKNYLNAIGHFAYQNGKGNGNINIDIPKIGRKIKGNGDITIQGTLHTANVELLYDAEKDPSKSIKFSTQSDIAKNSIDTKNVLEVLGQKLEFNVKGKLDGTLINGQLDAEGDVTLPNGHYITCRGTRTSKKVDDKLNVQANSEIAYYLKKGGEARKLTYTVDLKDYDRLTTTFQSKSQLGYIGLGGKDLHMSLEAKSLPGSDAGTKALDIAYDVHGSILPKPFHLSYDHQFGLEKYKYNIKTSYGSDLQLKGTEYFIRGDFADKPWKYDGSWDVVLPNDKLRNIKVAYTNDYKSPTEKGGPHEYTGSAAVTYNDDKTIKAEVYGKYTGDADILNKSEAAGKLTLTVLNSPPLTLGGSLTHDGTQELKKDSGTFNINCGEKEASIALTATYPIDYSSFGLTGKITTPVNKLRNIDLQLDHKREKDGKYRKTDVAIVADGVKYTFNGEIHTDETAPLMHLIFTCPAGKTELFTKFQKLGERDYSGEWKVITPYGFVVSDAHVNLESVDNFVINVNFDSDKVKPRKVHAEIANKPTAKTGRRITITVTSDGKNIVTGSTNYKKREEDGQIIVEGNGSMKIGDSTRSSSFKYTRQQLTREKDGEIGVAIVLNANFGPSAIVGELKLSNKEVHVFNSYCEQSKDCAHFKLQSTLDTDRKPHVKHQITVEVDLKKFDVPAEFGLKTSTEYKDFFFDHTASLYLHSSKDKTEYTYKVYVHPKESAIVLTLPTRELAAIVTFELPKTKQTGAYKLDAAVYLDAKNKPQEKTGVLVNGDVNVDKNSLSLSGEAKFVYPSQTKDLAVKGRLHYGGEHLLDANLDVDVFAKKSQKIVVVAKVIRHQLPKGYNVSSIVEVNSRGQQLKVDLKSHLAVSTSEVGCGTFLSYTDQHQKPKSIGGLFSANFEEIHLYVTTPNKEIVKSDTKILANKNQQKIETELAFLGNKPIVFDFDAQEFNNFKYLQYSKENPKDKLVVDGRVVIGQLAEVHADAFKDGAKKDLFHVLIHLDEGKFLKPDFGYNKDNINGLIEYYRNKVVQLVTQLKDLSVDIADETKTELNDLIDHLVKAQPNIQPLLDYYKTELNKLKDELHADQTIKEIQATLNKYFGTLITAITETLKHVVERYGELHKQYKHIISKIGEAVQATYPQLKESYKKILRISVEIFNAATELGVTYLKTIVEIINDHQKELKELTIVVSDFVQDFAKILYKAASQLKKDIDEFDVLLLNQLKALPIYDYLKQKYEEVSHFEVPEIILSPIEEMCRAIKNVLPTPELRDFFDASYEYVLKHVKRQKVDDAAELKKIYQRGITALRSIISLLESHITLDNFSDYFEVPVTPVDFGFLAKLPSIFSLKFSVLNLLRGNELPSLLDIYYTFRPTRHISDILPPFSKTGIIADGGHIFTFDGRHLTLPGTCTYILAQDMRDGNFSVVANLNAGNLASITVTEPKESITIKPNGHILVNNKPGDFPANTKNLHAFYTTPVVHVKSEYGVHVMCSDKTPILCTVRVSGYYLGKLRGLFGDANNEPYDDYTLPSGKITESDSDFANGYKLKPDCPAATAIDHKSLQRAPACTKYFSGYGSSLSSCFHYVNPSNYRDACDQAVTTHPEGACLIAAAYYAACYEYRLFGLSFPQECALPCKVGNKDVAVGDTFSVKIPKKEADIIFVVEQDVQNEKIVKELVGPLMADLREELKHHGITDPYISLVGYGEHIKWPQHYTLGGSLNIDGEVKNMKFDKKDPIITLQEAKEGSDAKKLEYLGQRLDVEFGTFKLTDAYEEAIRYPFRPGAAKVVVGILATPCEKSPLPISLQQLRLLVGQKVYRDLGLTYYHFSFPGEILVSDKPQKNIVGYDSEGAYTFADSKKKPLGGGNPDIKDNLVTSVHDVCADFAISSGGAAFSSNNFLDAKPNQKKQFAQVAARRIVDGIVNLELEEDCVCQQYGGLVGRPQCKIIDRKEKPLARHTKGNGVKG